MRITLSLGKEQLEILDKMMKEDLQTNRSTFIVYLISQENKSRHKPKVGRPRKQQDDDEDTEWNPDYSDDLPKNIPHFGKMIGPREYADKEEIRQAFRPQG